MIRHEKHLLQSLLFLLMTFFFSCDGEKEIHYMSYNVRDCKGMDDSVSYVRTASVINKLKPDVVAIQELDSVTKRSKGKYVLGELAELTGMYATYSPSIDFSGGKYGIGMLSKEKPLKVRRYSLPGREEKRSLLVAEFDNYVCCCTHLSLTKEDRMASLPIIQEIASLYSKPFFIAGDWNATPGSLFIKEICRDFTLLTDTSEFTFPADTPQCTLDYIALKKDEGLKVLARETSVVEAPLESDHRPVIVRLRWK